MDKEERATFDAELIAEPVATPRTGDSRIAPSETGKDHAAGIAQMMMLMGLPQA
jgi:hypothetical protein